MFEITVEGHAHSANFSRFKEFKKFTNFYEFYRLQILPYIVLSRGELYLTVSSLVLNLVDS